MLKLTIHSGESIVDNACASEHPVIEVRKAVGLISFMRQSNIYEQTFASNSPDFISAIFALSLKHKDLEVEYILDGVSQGSDPEPIFADFNRSIDLIKDINDV